MRCKKNEVLVHDTAVGSESSQTFHYGDSFECPECKFVIVTGFGAGLDIRSFDGKEAARSVLYTH